MIGAVFQPHKLQCIKVKFSVSVWFRVEMWWTYSDQSKPIAQWFAQYADLLHLKRIVGLKSSVWKRFFPLKIKNQCQLTISGWKDACISNFLTDLSSNFKQIWDGCHCQNPECPFNYSKPWRFPFCHLSAVVCFVARLGNIMMNHEHYPPYQPTHTVKLN